MVNSIRSQEIKTNIRRITRNALPILQAAGVKRAALFGSIVRGEERADSDIDMLVELPPDQSLLDLAGLKINLEDSLGRKVDVLTYNGVHPLLKESIAAEQLPIL